MRRILLPLGLAAAICFSAAAATSAVAEAMGNGIQQGRRTPSSYPAIDAWVAMDDRPTLGCLVPVIRRYNGRLSQEETMTLVDAILGAAFQHDLDPLLVASVIAAESSFNPWARSRCGAEGLMQLTRPLQPWIGVSDPYDIRQNVAGGCRYLTSLRKRFGRLDLVLAAYNAGPGRVARLRRVPDIEETKRYVRRVASLHTKLSAEARGLASQPGHPRLRDPFVLT